MSGFLPSYMASSPAAVENAIGKAQLEVWAMNHAIAVAIYVGFVLCNVCAFAFGALFERYSIMTSNSDAATSVIVLGMFARGFGIAAGWNSGILVVFMCRSLGRACVAWAGVHSWADHSIRAHTHAAAWAISCGALHGACQAVLFGVFYPCMRGRPRDPTCLGKGGATFGPFGLWLVFATGVALVAVCVAMAATAIEKARKKNFRRFYAVHQVCLCAYYILLALHSARFGSEKLWQYPSSYAALLFFLEYVYRLYGHFVAPTATLVRVTVRGEDTMQLEFVDAGFCASFSYSAGQYAEILIPSISRFEWHPFTISSSPSQAGPMTMNVKIFKNWTRKLRGLLDDDGVDGGASATITVHIRGPFGPQHRGPFPLSTLS